MTISGATNLCDNPSFETNTSGWSIANASGITATLAQTSSHAWVGTQSGLVNITANTGAAGATSIITRTILGIIPGRNYTLSAEGYQTNAALPGGLQITWLDASNAVISTSAAPFGTALNKFLLAQLNDVAPPLAAKANIQLTITSAGSGNLGGVYWDGIDFRNADRMDIYIDGSQGVGYHWTGTPHLSTSYRDDVTEIKNVGVGGMIAYDFSIMRTDITGARLDSVEYADYALSASITYAVSAQNPLTLALSMLEPPTGLTAFSDCLMVTATYVSADGSVKSGTYGPFVTTPAQQEIASGYEFFNIKAYDPSYLLARSGITGSLTWLKGNDPIAKLNQLLISKGFANLAIASPGKALAADLNWAPGVSLLQIATEAVNAVGMYIPWFVGTTLTSRIYDDDETITPTVFYDTTQASCPVVGAVIYDPSAAEIANQVVVVIAHPNNVPTTVTRTNSAPDSPTSTVNVGTAANPITISDTITDATITDVATATARAKKELQEKGRLYTTADLITLPDIRGQREFYSLNIISPDGQRSITGVWYQQGWVLDLMPNSTTPMLHHLARTQNLGQVV